MKERSLLVTSSFLLGLLHEDTVYTCSVCLKITREVISDLLRIKMWKEKSWELVDITELLPHPWNC
jgi:cytidine deaminase